MCGYVIKEKIECNVSCHLHHTIEAFTATPLTVSSHRQSNGAFWCVEAQWRACWRLLCYGFPPQSLAITAQSSRWNERSASLS